MLAKNTLELFILASKRDGIETCVIRNLQNSNFLKKSIISMTSFQKQKLTDDIRQLHVQMDHDLQIVIDMLNEELDLCL
ncbi:unnamed protein product [Cunninghamella echinulata]